MAERRADFSRPTPGRQLWGVCGFIASGVIAGAIGEGDIAGDIGLAFMASGLMAGAIAGAMGVAAMASGFMASDFMASGLGVLAGDCEQAAARPSASSMAAAAGRKALRVVIVSVSCWVAKKSDCGDWPTASTR
jgi:hypothetical protein